MMRSTSRRCSSSNSRNASGSSMNLTSLASIRYSRASAMTSLASIFSHLEVHFGRADRAGDEAGGVGFEPVHRALEVELPFLAAVAVDVDVGREQHDQRTDERLLEHGRVVEDGRIGAAELARGHALRREDAVQLERVDAAPVADLAELPLLVDGERDDVALVVNRRA